MAAKKAPNEKTDKVMETLEIWMALKKNIQWTAIKNPTKTNLKNSFGGTTNDFFLNKIKKNKKAPAKSILYQTKASALMDINAPNIAVNPQIKTIKWRFK